MCDDKVIAVKVFSFPKKKKVRSVSDEELKKFEALLHCLPDRPRAVNDTDLEELEIELRPRSNALVKAIRASERLAAADYDVRANT